MGLSREMENFGFSPPTTVNRHTIVFRHFRYRTQLPILSQFAIFTLGPYITDSKLTPRWIEPTVRVKSVPLCTAAFPQFLIRRASAGVKLASA